MKEEIWVFSFRKDNTDFSLVNITFHFFTNYIETETACQWQICNKKPLTCQLSVHHDLYTDQKGFLSRSFFHKPH